MRKRYTVIIAVSITATLSAQNKLTGTLDGSQVITKHLTILPMNDNRAIGDTLMWLPSPDVHLRNASDQTTFTIVKEDVDGFNPYMAGETRSFQLYYSTNNSMAGSATPTKFNFYHPWEHPTGDSSFFYKATSWFTPAGRANNWLMMGPITLPAGATLKWLDRTAPAYRDGYNVFISTTVSVPMISTDFTSVPIYTKTDSYPSETYVIDTTWTQRSVGIPAIYSARPIYIAFQHNANDMDALYLDEFLVVESTASVPEFSNGAKLFQNTPNPTNGISVVNYELEKSAQVALNVYDVTGKVVCTQIVGEQNSGIHTMDFNAEHLTSGLYYYALKVNNNTTVALKMVVIK